MHSLLVKAGAVALIVFGIIFAVILEKSREESDSLVTLRDREVPVQTTEDFLSDTDNDGLKKWQENLWHTDPNNPDSDGDGTNDGVEVANNRDPLKRPPDSRASVVSDTTSKGEIDIFTGTKPKIIIGEESETQTSDGEIEAADPLRKYGNDLGLLISNHLKNTGDWESSIFQAIIRGPTAQDFDDLADLGKVYATLSEKISSLESPPEAAGINKSLVLSYKNQSDAILKLASYKSALAVPTSQFESYNSTVIATGKALLSLVIFFENQGVTFSPEEAGSIFVIPKN